MITATDAGWIGIWVLIGSGVVILVELAVMGVWSARLARRGQALAVVLQREQGQVQADLERLLAALEETRQLWKPYRRVLRWLRHPLVIALIGHYRRRI